MWHLKMCHLFYFGSFPLFSLSYHVSWICKVLRYFLLFQFSCWFGFCLGAISNDAMRLLLPVHRTGDHVVPWIKHVNHVFQPFELSPAILPILIFEIFYLWRHNWYVMLGLVLNLGLNLDLLNARHILFFFFVNLPRNLEKTSRLGF